jgi:GT2 family glycosyltransferase
LVERGLCSVVIAARNEGEMLRRTVASVLNDTAYAAVEVVVVDDGSTDGSCGGLDGDGRVRVVRGRELGAPGARNLGAAHARGEYLVFLDAHCRVSANWLDVMLAALEPPDVAVVGPTFTKLDAPEPRGCGMTWVSPRLETAWIVPPEDERPSEVPLAPGGCQAYRARTFGLVGRFDEGMTRWGFEDVEICLRAWLLGYRVVGAPRATVAHHFRDRRNFDVPPEGVLFNFLRLIHLHFAPWRIEEAIRALGPYPGIDDALARLARSDVLDLRAELEAVRVRDDDWFFALLAPSIGWAQNSTPRRPSTRLTTAPSADRALVEEYTGRTSPPKPCLKRAMPAVFSLRPVTSRPPKS